MPQVSIIVPIFNGSAFLPAFFQSLNEALPEGSQVVLIDDGSSESVWETIPEVSRADSLVRLRNDGNFGYSVAVNRGFAVATGEIVVQLNTDLVLDADCIGAMIELIQREERVGIVGSKLVYPTTGLVQHVGMAFGNYTNPHIFSQLPATHALCGVTRELQITTGATVAMTRRVLNRLGPLDERYFNHNEDLEHCLLAVKAGLRNFMCAESVAYHWESHSGPSRFARMRPSDAMFWSTWGATVEVDLDRFIDEALDHVLQEFPQLEGMPFEVLDLSRGVDQLIVLERLAARWPGLTERIRTFRQMNNPSGQFALPLLLPHWIASEPVPFIYLVDVYRELEENILWAESRRGVVADELIVDLKGAALHTSEVWP